MISRLLLPLDHIQLAFTNTPISLDKIFAKEPEDSEVLRQMWKFRDSDGSSGFYVSFYMVFPQWTCFTVKPEDFKTVGYFSLLCRMLRIQQ